MTRKPKAIFCWSGGKDSAYGLHKVLAEKLFDVKYLLTTFNDPLKRISMCTYPFFQTGFDLQKSLILHYNNHRFAGMWATQPLKNY